MNKRLLKMFYGIINGKFLSRKIMKDWRDRFRYSKKKKKKSRIIFIELNKERMDRKRGRKKWKWNETPGASWLDHCHRPRDVKCR